MALEVYKLFFSLSNLILFTGTITSIVLYFSCDNSKNYIPSLLVIITCILSVLTSSSAEQNIKILALTAIDPTIFVVLVYTIIGKVIINSELTSLLMNIIFKNSFSKGVQLLILYLIAIVCSAVINNLIVVYVFIQISIEFSKKHEYSLSKLLMPLSFLAILSGTSTLIGTNTTLLAYSAGKELSRESLSFFELLPNTVPIVLGGLAYVLLFSSKMLKKDDEGSPAIKSLLISKQKYGIILAVSTIFIAKILPSFNFISLYWTALIALINIIIFTRLTPKKLLKLINWNLILLVTSSLLLSKTLAMMGVVELISKSVLTTLNALDISNSIVIWIFFMIVVITTNFFYSGLTVLIFVPVAYSLSSSLGIPHNALVYTAIIASNCSLLTKFGYQTNFLVSEIAKYTSKDYLKFGFPLTMIISIIHSAVISLKFF